jgi:hypothetical protein
MRAVTADPTVAPHRRKAVRSAFLRKFTPEQRQGLLVRFYLDALKGAAGSPNPNSTEQ